MVSQVRSSSLLGVKEMPKVESRLNLDFASALGPLFFVWVVQLPMPSILVSIVYEKETKLRIMMKMMGVRSPPLAVFVACCTTRC